MHHAAREPQTGQLMRNSGEIFAKISHRSVNARALSHPLRDAKSVPTAFDSSHSVPSGNTIVEIVK